MPTASWRSDASSVPLGTLLQLEGYMSHVHPFSRIHTHTNIDIGSICLIYTYNIHNIIYTYDTHMYEFYTLYICMHINLQYVNIVCHGYSQFLCRSVGQPWAVSSAPRCSIISWLMALKRRPLSSSFCQILGRLEFEVYVHYIYVDIYIYVSIYI